MAEHKDHHDGHKKPFFKSFGKNKMSLKTDKAFYVSGELVTGTIKVKLADDVVCKGVMFKVTGYEKAEWEELETKTCEVEVERENEEGGTETVSETRFYDEVEEHEGKKEFFKERMLVSEAVELLPEGVHEFPFQYQLPPGLPGVFEYKKKRKVHKRDQDGGSSEEELKVKAKIVYKLKCYLDFDRAKDLTAKQELVVHEMIEGNINPSHDEITREVMLCCCIPRGQCELKAVFDKNQYVPGELAQCMAKIDNRSKSDVGEMSVKLMRTIRLKNKHGRDYNIVDTILEANYEGVPAETDAERAMPLQLAGDLQPSTNGKICHCNYHFDVECNISMAPDIELHMPVVLYAPPPMVWGVPMEDME
jgi:hypothetical protein